MRRCFALLVLFVLSIPVGLSITGCQTNVGAYCNGLGYGPKTNQVNAISMGPATTGISLSWGQTAQLGSPSASTCKGASASVGRYNYGSSNLYLADVSPTGSICGGTWNRNSPGGIADYTICTPPAGATGGTCTATSCGQVLMTAAAAGVTSNPVPVYVHPPITSISFAANTPGSPQAACFSQNTPGPVLTPAQLPNPAPGQPPLPPTVIVLGPDGSQIPAADVGTITYTPVNTSIVSINNTSSTGTGVNGATTANMPGSTVINASLSLSSSGSAAGYFYTCPPASIDLSVVSGNTNSSGVTTVSAGTPVSINAVIKDTKGAALNGLSLDYTSTAPENISVSPLGQVTGIWPGIASITAICQPSTCNPAPISQIGVFGTGTPVVSNTLHFTSPGTNSNYLWMASTQSQFFSSIDLTTGTPGSPILLPYVPNSMVMDQLGANLYFGSYRELMVYSTATNALTKQDTTVPGVVLAVAPSGADIVINDQLRQVIYIYANATGTTTGTTTGSGTTTTAPTGVISSISGVATSAEFSPDGKNIYITGPNSLYVYNTATGWSTYNSATTPPGPTQPTASCTLNNNTPGTTSGTPAYDPFCGPSLTIPVPSIGTFVSGSPTTAWGFCPNVTNPAAPVYYPQAASIGIQTDQLAATDDGQHILGADPTTFSDINIMINPGPCPNNGGATQPSTLPLTLTPTFNQLPLSITASEIDQVVASPASSVAFVTYNNNNQTAGTGLLPAYVPSATATTPGTITNVQLSGTAKSPIAGIFSPNTTIFFVSTSGDNLVHFINPTTLTDTKTINPGLTSPTGTPVPVQMMAVKPRSTI